MSPRLRLFPLLSQAFRTSPSTPPSLSRFSLHPPQRLLLRNHASTKPDFNLFTNPETATIDRSIAISQTFSDVKAELHFTRYDTNARPAASEKLTKADIAKAYGITTRDLRTIDLPSNDHSNIQIRQSAIIIELLDLRLIVGPDEMLLVHIPGFISHHASSVFCYNLENRAWGTHVSNKPINQAFELRVLDEALASVTATLQSEYLATKVAIIESTRKLDQDMHDPQATRIHVELQNSLERVRHLSNVGQRARRLSSVLEGILNDDEDMAEAYLSDAKAGKPHVASDHQEVEYLLETYFKATEDTAQGVSALVDDIYRTERTVQSILSVRRNQLMVLEVKMEIAMVGLASVTFIAGLYGMNVVNFLEESTWAFALLTSTCVIGIAGIWRLGIRALSKIQASR